MLQLAKAALDVGLYTNNRDAALAFWSNELALPYSEMLPVGRGVQQHRYLIGTSVLKVNHSREPLPAAAPSGIRTITIHRPGGVRTRQLQDPDGNVVFLRGALGANEPRLSVQLIVSDLPRHEDFYGRVLGLPALGSHGFACGTSHIELAEGAAFTDPDQRALGYRYLTVQVFDVKQTHAAILARGGREGMAPVKLGDVAHISFVRDPDGNWIEISQRKSLTGSLD